MLSDTIAQCKVRLPMPDLWARLGLRGEPKRSCNSPFREDKLPSFSVFQVGKQWFYKDHATGESGDEISLIQRHAGCEKADAIRSYHELSGVKMESVKSKVESGKGLGKIVAIYDYMSADGKLVHQKLRYEPKRFLQRRPASEGMHAGNKKAKRDRAGNWWIWTLEGIEPVLFRLPELLKSPELTVVICEGEKDAIALGARCPMFATTTAPDGATHWRKSFTETLKDRDVVIALDRDKDGSPKAGQKGAQIIARALSSAAKRVRIVNWSKLWRDAAQDVSRKLDISDFLATCG